MKEYRYSIRDDGTYYTDTEYYETVKQCKDELYKFMNSLYFSSYFGNDTSIMIDTLEDNIIIDSKIIKGKEFIIT